MTSVLFWPHLIAVGDTVSQNKKKRIALTICNNYCFSTATMVARIRLIVTLYVHALCFNVDDL